MTATRPGQPLLDAEAVTLHVDRELLRLAKVQAQADGFTLYALVRTVLRAYVDQAGKRAHPKASR